MIGLIGVCLTLSMYGKNYIQEVSPGVYKYSCIDGISMTDGSTTLDDVEPFTSHNMNGTYKYKQGVDGNHLLLNNMDEPVLRVRSSRVWNLNIPMTTIEICRIQSKE